MSDPPVVPVIVGPTASGKTAVAVALARLLGHGSEIVSADSVQVYRRLDIGSAKPVAAERQGVPFSLIDVAEPDTDFTLSDFQGLASQAVARIAAAGGVPIVCGGTGLYIRSLTQPLNLPRVAPDAAFRERWREYEAREGSGALHRRLASLDPAAAEGLHPNDVLRIIRALEVLEFTGRPLSEWHGADREQGAALLPRVLIYGLSREPGDLAAAISARARRMMADGFLAEVRDLRRDGYARDLRPLRSLGYKELYAHLDGELTLPEAVEQITVHTRQFARRQRIWFRADERVRWLDASDEPARVAAGIAAHLHENAPQLLRSSWL